AETNRALMAAGRRVIVLADHTKWGTIGISSVGSLDAADTIVTDSGLDPEASTVLTTAVRRVIFVDPDSGEKRIVESNRGESSALEGSGASN
ncbi:MAG: hypothetical protein ACXWNI_01255, partial [Candidatus Limnocylindrales bacterium]